MNNPIPEPAEEKNNQSPNDTEVIAQVKTATTDALLILKYLIIDLPNLPVVFSKYNKERIIKSSIALGCFSLIAFTIATKSLIESFSYLGFGTSRYYFIPIIAFITLASASLCVRKLFKAEGTLEGDLFTSGTTIIPTGIFLLLASFLGAANIEIIILLLVFNIIHTTLILHTCITKISNIKEKYSSVSIGIIIALTIWFSKILVTSVIL
ncbi:MAG: hypothetical protein ACXITR_00280 [Cyanobacterium sp.]